MKCTFKYRLFTNANQERELGIALETHRRLYNAALDGKILCWETAGVSWTFYDQCKWLTVQRKLNPHLARIGDKSGGITLDRLNRAFSAFFKRCQTDSSGYPRFKGKDHFNSFGFQYLDGCKIVDGKLRLFNIGQVRIRWHRALPDRCRIKQVTILREQGRWFACFAIEVPDQAVAQKPTVIGVDVGLKAFVTTSDGEQIGDSRALERALPELRRRQRALSRCKRGSNRRKLVKAGVQKLHANVRNVRRDLHHKVSRSLVDRYGTIAAESLNVKNMLKNRRLARRISDAGWYQFITILTSKAESAGSRVILVDPKNTSQECHNCGALVHKDLKQRIHSCECGVVIDRDWNAALNILARAEPAGVNVGNSLHSPKSRRVKSLV